MVEYGIFTSEGCIEAQLYSMEEAERRLAYYRAQYDADETPEERISEMSRDQEDCEAGYEDEVEEEE